jgi:hypothetical protein
LTILSFFFAPSPIDFWFLAKFPSSHHRIKQLLRKFTTAIKTTTTMKTSFVFLTLFSPLLVLAAVEAQSADVSEQPDKLVSISVL